MRLSLLLRFSASTLATIAPLFAGWLFITGAFADEAEAQRVWTQFRRTFPYHLQTIGLSEADKTNERVLIISEPPPWFDKRGIETYFRTQFGDAFRNVALKRHPIGFDGWVDDIVVRFGGPRSRDEAWLRSQIADLHRELFGTAYKASALRLPVAALKPGDIMAPINLQSRPGEFKKWFFDDEAKMVSLMTGEEEILRQLLTRGRPDTYFSKQIGLVVLLLPTDSPIDFHLAAIRHFAIDTDSVLGAIALTGGRRLAIIGRERSTSVIAMPPLRTETVLRLAATKQMDLGQSYERNSPFAGKLVRGADKGQDWAPIYLSDDLLNTEFGSLLNITDQMLKSWSEAGNIDYVNFSYPKPQLFPFAEGVMNHIGTERLTYNWNTSGVGSVTNFDDIRIFTILNTGSLPVSYFPEGTDDKTGLSVKASKAEDEAYQYFSNLRDSNLARVVALSSLYQIFQQFPVKVDHDELKSLPSGAFSEDLVAKTEGSLRSIAAGNAAINKARLDFDIGLEATKLDVPFYLALQLQEKLQLRMTARIQDVQRQLQSYVQLYSDDVFRLFAQLMVNRLRNNEAAIRRLESIATRTDTRSDWIRKAKELSQPDRDNVLRLILALQIREDGEILNGTREALKLVGDTEDVRNDYVRLAASETQNFIRTPTIVLSRDRVEVGSVGGHNLYGRSTSVVTDPSVARGGVVRTFDNNGTVLRINPEDANAAPNVARTFERSSKASAADLDAALTATASQVEAVRPMQSALDIGSKDIQRVERGATIDQQGVLSLGPAGWRVPANAGDTFRAAERAAGQYQIEVIKDGTSYVIHRFIPVPPGSVRILSSAEFPSVFKAIASRAANSNAMPASGLVVRGANMSAGEMEALAKTVASGGGGGGARFVRGGEFANPDGGGRPWWALFRSNQSTAGAGYLRATRGGTPTGSAGETTVLSLLGKIDRMRPRLEQPLDWGKAHVDFVGTRRVPDGEFGKMYQGTWDLTVPPKSTSEVSVKARIQAFFRKALGKEETDNIERVIKESISANGSLNGIDGFAELKADIMRISRDRPDALLFHLNEGADDLTITRREQYDGNRGG